MQESIVTELKTIMEDTEHKDIISVSEVTYGLQLVEQLHQQSDEQELSQSIVTELKAIMVGVEAKNNISVSEATYGLQLVEQLHQQCGEQELSQSIVAELKAIMVDAEAKNNISVSEATYGLQLVEQLHRQSGEAELSEETTFENTKTVLDPDEVEMTSSIVLVNEALQLVEEVHRQDNEIKISVPCAELNNKFVEVSPEAISEHDAVMTTSNNLVEQVHQPISEHYQDENITFDGQETCLVKGVETEVIIPSVETTEMLVDEETKQVPKDNEVQKTCVIDPTTNDPCLAEDLIQHENETELGFHGKSSTPVANTEPEVGTVSSIEVVIVDEEKEVDELEFLNVVMNQKLKRIEEIAKQVKAIDVEMAQMTSECGERKRRHAEFIDLLKLIVESQLPLHTHREIQKMIRKKDKAAQEMLSNALDLQVCIDARAKLKLSLQEESRELAKVVESRKLQIHQKLKDPDQVIKLDEEAVDSGTGRHCNKINFTDTRKRKSHHDGQSADKEICSSEMQTKRMALNPAGDSVQAYISD